jgi:hypothetical protein
MVAASGAFDVYRFQKLYMDLVDADGNVCITYAAELHALGFSRNLGGVELYRPNGDRQVHRATSARWSRDRDSVELRGSFDQGEFLVRHCLTEGGWEPAGDPVLAGFHGACSARARPPSSSSPEKEKWSASPGPGTAIGSR